jgi:copper/silver efflux system protein
VCIIFEEGNIYWTLSRTLEYLNSVVPRLPKGVGVELAKDATAVGWVHEYALVDTTGKTSIEKMRSFQDWYLNYTLQSVPGVAEVAPLGGFVRQY